MSEPVLGPLTFSKWSERNHYKITYNDWLVADVYGDVFSAKLYARLFAAAPDLLAVAKALIEHFGDVTCAHPDDEAKWQVLIGQALAVVSRCEEEVKT